MFGFPLKYIIATVAIIAVVGGGITWYKIQMSAQFEAGRNYEREEQRKRAEELNRQRERNSEELRNMPDHLLLCELAGGVWRNGQCD